MLWALENQDSSEYDIGHFPPALTGRRSLHSPEVIIILDDGVSNLNAVHTSVSEGLLEKDRSKSFKIRIRRNKKYIWKHTRIEVLANVLQQTGLTELDRVLDEFEIVWVGVLQLKQNFVTTPALVEMISLNFPPIPNLYCHQVVLLLHVLHPLGSLTLRIDHQSPSERKICKQDEVFWAPSFWSMSLRERERW